MVLSGLYLSFFVWVVTGMTGVVPFPLEVVIEFLEGEKIPKIKNDFLGFFPPWDWNFLGKRWDSKTRIWMWRAFASGFVMICK